MAGKKGVFRLAILILLIPVGLLLVLHFFGENRMDVQVIRSLNGCDSLSDKTAVYASGSALSKVQLNQLTRIRKALERKRLEILPAPSECFGDTIAIQLVDKEKNLRGSYSLEQSDVNRLFVELDIVLMHDSYGEGVSR